MLLKSESLKSYFDEVAYQNGRKVSYSNDNKSIKILKGLTQAAHLLRQHEPSLFDAFVVNLSPK